MNSQATVDLVLNPKKKKNEPRTIVLRVIFQGIPRQYTVGAKNKYVADDISLLNRRYKEYKEEIDGLEEKKLMAKQIVKELDKDFSFESFKAKYHERAFGKVLNKPEKQITDLAKLWELYEKNAPISPKTKDQYHIGFNWIFAKHKSITIDKLNVDFFNALTQFIKKEYRKDKIATYKKKHGIEPTSVKEIEDVTISTYYRGINTVLTYLVDAGYIDTWNSPFGKGKRQIRAVNKVSSGRGIKDDDLQMFANYSPLADGNKELKEFGWCFYMLCFQCGGMNPIDIYGLKNKNLRGNEINFIRQKTSGTSKIQKETSFQIPTLSKLIMTKFGRIDTANSEEYIFPYFELSFTEKQKRNKADSLNEEINKGVTLICEELGIPRYTLGGSRHSQATYLSDAMGDENLVQTIAERMAHNNPQITQKHYIELTKNKKARITAILDNLVSGNAYFNAENYFQTNKA